MRKGILATLVITFQCVFIMAFLMAALFGVRLLIEDTLIIVTEMSNV